MGALAAVEVAGALALLVLIVLGAIFGWERYRGNRPPGLPAVGFRPTTEVFINPETGQRVRVWYDDRTGAREYRPE
ncbi:MAG TPA: hypothetical protein VEK76_03290 [Candidatus Binatia bacterium]|nr:hypothetical protein [Candidatus Binatia bacterium]